MRFHADHYFAMGSAHLSSGKPCQDHALSETSDTLAAAVISDGCSSGGHTDVGARIMTLSTMQAMRTSVRVQTIAAVEDLQKNLLVQARSLFSLAKSDMLATCAYACATSQDGAIVHVQGDGAVAIQMRDGAVDLHHFEWQNNAPFYPAYAANGEEYLFFAYHGARTAVAMGDAGVFPGGPELLEACRVFVKNGSFDGMAAELIDGIIGFGKVAPTLTVETVKIDTAGRQTSSKQAITTEVGARGHVIHVAPEFLSQVRLIAVFSDGVSQVDNIDWQEAATTFLGAKVLRGEFVKRSMIFGIRGMKNRGKGPIDDVSAAMICVEDDDV